MKIRTTSHHRGFSLVEMLTIIAVLVVLMAISTPYLVGARNKSLLLQEADKLAKTLEYARQQSIGAYDGQEYSVELYIPTRSFTLQPTGKTTVLDHSVEITTGPAGPIVFQKLTGHVDPATIEPITFVRNNFTTTITINSLGVIQTTPAEKI